ncbi:MAG: amidohydrolase family protein [Candidatus Heimdallarchaeota archaeon]|nr:amidohydrolase family protein [Candidatus Heimdallarchaeota archaeon]
MSKIVLINASILDVKEGKLVPNKHIVIADGKIVSIQDDFPEVEDAQIIDIASKIVMPGLCDAHVHVLATTADLQSLSSQSPNYLMAQSMILMRDMLMRGFTTVRDAAGADWGIAKAVEDGIVEGPRILYCGYALSQTGGHGDGRGSGDDSEDFYYNNPGLGRICDGISEVRKAARNEIRKGAHHIKIMASGGVASPTDRVDSIQFSEEEISAIVDEAQSAKIYVIAHAYTADAINRALKLGVRSIEHGNLLDEESIELFLKHDAFLVPTLVTYQALSEEGMKYGLSHDSYEKLSVVLDAGLDSLELAYKQGVNIAYGTDLLGEMQKRQLEELTIRAKVMSPIDVIRTATINAAELFGIKGITGQVEIGVIADLLVLDGNPMEDLNVLVNSEINLRLIMKDGKIFKNTL